MRSSAIAAFVADESVLAVIATIAGSAPPGNDFWIFWIVPTVAMPFGSASSPVCAVWMWSAGNASTTSTAADATAETSGCFRAGVRIADQKRFSPLGRRSRLRNGMRPFSTRSPSFESSAGSTVSEPSIATATTIIVAIPNDR